MAQSSQASPAEPAALADQRRAMIEIIQAEVRRHGCGELDPRVVAAIGNVPRERFVPEDQGASAYANRPLSIGHDQTISQPLIVAVMTDLLHIGPGARVLEVGTGSGYQTAVLANLAGEVVTIEVIEALAAEARTRLDELGYRNVEFHRGDGALGCPGRAPFDAILVTAAARSVPPALIDQLKPGGHMVIPIGADPASQELVLLEKDPDGRIDRRSLFPVAFVPLTQAEPKVS
ncbi:MAG: protein-L-isoaspartate(D-aspartate) O-methyltransferase [Geminicoccaceae bacterium]